MKVLVIGKGGREHALAWRFAKSEKVTEVFVAPGNPGMTDVATVVAIDEMDFENLIAFAQHENIDLTFVGPEAPLTEGIVDAFTAAGLKVFGPTKKAAQLEGSKHFTKALLEKYNIPTAKYATFTDYEAACAYVREEGAPIVIKADGLAAGKGVVVAMSEEEAMDALEAFLVDGKFGEASKLVVIEEYLEGPEFSFMAFTHGETVLPMIIAQDHKRAFDGDKGPNTGGMGAYSPVPQIGQHVTDDAYENILKPVAAALVQEGCSFTGILYAGLMLTENGPKVIEFNARFGDPETEIILPRMVTPLEDVILALLDGGTPSVEWDERCVVGVVLAANGYPDAPEKGYPITGFEQLNADTLLFHAGTTEEEGICLSNGGRVLLLACYGESLERARHNVYDEITKIKSEGLFWRSDIGTNALQLK
ncbi:MAG: phosphoribosylamine--glycine ligase [Bacilli bacterium]